MTKFSDISIGILVLIVIVAIIEICIIHKQERHYIEPYTQKDYISMRIEHYIENQKRKPAKLSSLIKSAKSGFLRGALLGLITYGVEGAVAGGLLLGIVNPIVMGIEHMI